MRANLLEQQQQQESDGSKGSSSGSKELQDCLIEAKVMLPYQTGLMMKSIYY